LKGWFFLEHTVKKWRSKTVKKPKMSLEAQLKGVTKAIDSPNTPPQLKKALGRRAAELQRRLNKKPSRGFLARLGF
jgi:hypothetical protein